ncbi:MAG TPA: Hpt domain-containing protein [Ramlibacter sp.]|jgi:chemotaxis protein histidine kinase CheA|uniref:Hpt domain-containing protein n=1 Tax=Ramlibacter sp. TaxID=1917967 RepID=UPI002D6FA78A|nr:Hpt domain-containing protein [Ramlibacter sp.]HZY20253.1 Hpt domain-containing protein [Ramlibacter sp.]
MSSADPPAAGAAPLSFQERMRLLQIDWQAQLPGRLEEAHRLLITCASSPDDAPAMEALHRLMHTLAGSAGTFGLAEFGLRARAIEDELDRLMAKARRSTADFGGVAVALQALRDTLGKA